MTHPAVNNLGKLIQKREISWDALIDGAERDGTFTLSEMVCANHWPTCACWNLPDNLKDEFYMDGRPTDDMLLLLGVSFNQAVKANNFAYVRRLVREIQDRIAELTL